MQTSDAFRPMPDKTEPRTCQTHGEYQSRVFVWQGREVRSGCPACAMQEAKDRAKAEIEEQARRRDEIRKGRIAARYSKAMIPPRFATKTLDDYEVGTEGQRRALAIARRYVEAWPSCLAAGRCLVFAGKPGTGKTHLSAAIACSVMAAGGTALFRTVQDAMADIKASYARDASQTERQAYASLVQPDLLVLDEVGVHTLTDHDEQMLFRVINARYEAVLPMILCTNLSGAVLARYLGDRIMDRVTENQGMIVLFDWESHRK